MRMKKVCILVIILSLSIGLIGCEAVRKKFTRKKKETTKMPHMYQVKKYEKQPTPELYKKHFSYWSSWSDELIGVLGQNHKKDSRCIEEIVSNLTDMQNILVPEKAAGLEVHIERMKRIREMISSGDLTFANKDTIKRTLEREDRFIKREFIYSKIKDDIKKSFDDTQAREI